MKRPKLNDYPITDDRTYKSFKGDILWKKYASNLNKYIDFLEDKIKNK